MNELQFQEQMLKVQAETLRKAQAEIGLKTESLKYQAARWAVIAAVLGLVAAGTTYINNLENQTLKARIAKLEEGK